MNTVELNSISASAEAMGYYRQMYCAWLELPGPFDFSVPYQVRFTIHFKRSGAHCGSFAKSIIDVHN